MPLDTEFVIGAVDVGLIFAAVLCVSLIIVGALVFRYPISVGATDGNRGLIKAIGGTICVLSIGFLLMLGGWHLREARLRQDYAEGRYTLVTGCLTSFLPSRGPGHTPDVIEVGGRKIYYSDSIDDGGYHLTELSGGVIHADSYVKLFLVNNVIVRVDVRQRACPVAAAAARS